MRGAGFLVRACIVIRVVIEIRAGGKCDDANGGGLEGLISGGANPLFIKGNRLLPSGFMSLPLNVERPSASCVGSLGAGGGHEAVVVIDRSAEGRFQSGRIHQG